MHFSSIAVLAISTLSFVAEAAPFTPKEGALQRSRRRAIDYPVSSEFVERRSTQHRKRALNYSVVQVDGSSPTPNQPAPPQTVVHTVTQPAVTSTETMLYTTVVQESEAPKTVVFTTTKIHEVQLKPTAPAAQPNIVFVSAQPVVMAPPVTTIIKTIVAPTPTSTTRYYDDGLWHTYYPMKSWFVPPQVTPTPSPGDDVQENGLYRRGSPRPVAQRLQRKRARAVRTGEPDSKEQPAASRTRPRKLSLEAQQAPWNVTRTELDGLRKFMN